MSDRPTIFHITRLGSIFRFQITKPDQVLAPIMKIWDVEVRHDLVNRLCEELAGIVKQHSHQFIPPQIQERISHLGKALYRQLIFPGLGGDHLQAVLGGDSLPLLISTNVPEIPWELLFDEQNFLGLKYAIGRQLLKSTTVPIATPWHGDRMRCLIIADPCNNLLEARAEAKTLKQWLEEQGVGCDLLLAEEANVTEVIIRLSSGLYNFIHYSGHVDTDPITKTPCLVLNDQKLSSTEIERAVSSNGPVVILNGCDTASVEGLADAFLKSGAQLIVGTLFDVPDLGARRWAEVFYKGLISKNQAGEALRLARQTTINDPVCSTAWMAFVMYGNPCLQLIWGKEPEEKASGTLLDHALEALGLNRKDFDNACLNILEGSLKYAGEAGGVSTAHLFTAMLEGPDGRLRDYLQSSKIDPAEIKKQFEKVFQFAELLGQAIAVDIETNIKFSESVIYVLQDACDRAHQAKRMQANFDDLLFAFSQRRSSISELLQYIGVNLKEMVSNSQADELPSRKITAPDDREPRDTVSAKPTTSETGSFFRTRGTQVTNNAGESTVDQLHPVSDEVEKKRFVAQRFADVAFPASIAISCWYALRIQILDKKNNDLDTEMKVEMPDQPGQPARVEVCVQAPGFEAMETLQRVIDVPLVGNSQLIEFHLRTSSVGDYKIRVDFIQNQRYIGTTQLEVIATDDVKTVSAIRDRKAKPIGQPFIGQTGKAPDLTILITESPLATGKHQLKFLLLSPSAEIGLYYRDAGESILNSSPVEWVEMVLKQAQDMARENDSEVERRLQSIGYTLWDQLIPEKLKNIYWQIREKVRTVQLVTDDPWIPWEMVRPYRREQQHVLDDNFLCQRFSLARWLRGAPASPSITINESRVVGAGFDSSQRFAPLPQVSVEVSVVKSILEKVGTHSVALPPSRTEFFHSLEAGGFQHLHIACHGGASFKDGDRAVIRLEDGALAPLDITGKAIIFGLDHPLIFLNACETGRMGTSLTQLGGWAERFIEVGCSAFIGTLWPVSDYSSQKFAESFYNEICKGSSLGEACRLARLAIQTSDDPTWLAYSLYADPQAVIVSPGILPKPDPSIVGEHSRTISDAIKLGISRAAEIRVDFIDSLLLFEVLLSIEGAFAHAFEQLSISVEQLIRELKKINNQKSPSRTLYSDNDIGLSKSVTEILKIAYHLAKQSDRRQIQDIDVLEAFVLHDKNSVIKLLTELKLEPVRLLSGAFQSGGLLKDHRFSKTAQDIINQSLQYARKAQMVGSPHILAALMANKDGLARKRLMMEGKQIDMDAYIQEILDKATIHNNRSEPQRVSMDTCSTRAICILNLAELLARSDGTPVEEEHILKAYLVCTQIM